MLAACAVVTIEHLLNVLFIALSIAYARFGRSGYRSRLTIINFQLITYVFKHCFAMQSARLRSVLFFNLKELKMNTDFAGKRVLIAGGTKGMGAAILAPNT